jgi:hypothetical protein
MATNFDTLEKTNKVIRLTAAPIRSTIFQLIGFAIVGGADVNKFTLNGSELTFKAPEFQDGSGMGGHDINIISIMIT